MPKTFDNIPVPQADAIPNALKELPQWVVWKLQTRPGETKPTKVPYCAATGEKASSTDAATWTTFGAALGRYERGGYSGIGFVFSPDDPYAGIDLDGCRDPQTGEIAPWAQKIIDRLNTYGETSPSGTGIKLIVAATHPGYGFKKDLGKTHGEGCAVEMYDAGRYFTITGATIPGAPLQLAERAGEFNAVHHDIFGDKPAPPKAAPRSVRAALTADSELLDKARAAGSGKFSALYDGDWQSFYGSQNSADLALCGMLAFWTGGDQGRMDSLFRGSGLMRDKWDERRGTLTYGQKTLNQALVGQTEFYDPGRAPSAADIAARVSQPKSSSPKKSASQSSAPSTSTANTAAGASQQQAGDQNDGNQDDEESSPFENDGYSSRENQDSENQEIEDYPDPRQLIADIQRTKDAAPIKRKAISAVVLTVLRRDGELHRDDAGGLWHFHSERHDLLRIPAGKIAGDEFESRLALRFGLNRTEPAYTYALADVVDAARALPVHSVLRRWSHYDAKADRLYVSGGNGYVYRLDGGPIQRLFNGEDGVLFSPHPQMSPLGDLDLNALPEPGQGLLENILTVNFKDTPDMSADHQRALWYGYVYSLPFESILPTKPIVTFVGEKGSGKSAALKRLSHMLLGPQATVSGLPPKVEDFDAALYNSRFLWLDNVDTYQPWLMDSLACAATGQALTRREYYTNMGVMFFTPHCWLGITTREPKFRRDDVADRTLLFTLARIVADDLVGENELMTAIDERREALFAEYLRDLNQIVAGLRADKAPVKSGMRLADWGDFYIRFMRGQKREADGHAALAALSQEQISFSEKGDPLFEMLDLYVPTDGGWTPEQDSSELCKELTTQAQEEKRDVHFKPHPIAARLSNTVDPIRRTFEVKIREGRARKRYYQFRRRPEEEPISSGER